MSRQSNSDLDRDASAIVLGNKAAGILKSIDPFLKASEDTILSNLAISAEKLTDAEIRLKVGELIGLRRFRAKLESTRQQGEIAAQRRP